MLPALGGNCLIMIIHNKPQGQISPFDVAVFSKYSHTKCVEHQTKYPYHPPPNIAKMVVKNLEKALTAAHRIH